MSLIPHTFLFQTSQSIEKLTKAASKGALKKLTEKYKLAFPGELDGQTPFADVRLGWSEHGLQIDVAVAEKSTAPIGSLKDPLSGDGVQLWIDTRNTPGVHRANRFCHLIVSQPNGGGKDQDEPIAQMLEVPRAREKSPLAEPEQFKTKSQVKADSYLLQLWIPAEVLNGFDPDQSPRIGFFYAIRDRELGLQTAGVGEEFPYQSDPSLWQTVELK